MLKTGVVKALGTMSGTSLDGVDAAVITTDGVDIMGFGPTDYRPYSTDERAVVRAALGRWQADDVAEPARIVEDAHIAVMSGFGPVDLAGFHGQTLAHDPGGRGTHQCGDGQRIADALGVPVVWDFRSADVAAGGQGAPLAPFYHFALARYIAATAPVVFLNLGGVGNLTWVDPACAAPELPGALLAFDTGPANAPINDLMQARRGQSHDKDGLLAASGVADATIVAEFLAHPYFSKPVPKSLDRDAFTDLGAMVAGLSDADAAATLACAVAAAVAAGLGHCPSRPARVLVTGGGRKNPVIMAQLAARLPCRVDPVEVAGLDGDMLEAQAFAYLAVRSARGMPISAPAITGVNAPMTGGHVSVPVSFKM
ncbi:anhydro-N-acetylmuramic acid kinase [Yoonia sp.]|uniref:anhydro-N-acetylmuramic acid kinase n=1 Tax=Yoonia sp. TaxID=2212373 RepID=UPI0019FD2E44|nr:anhydro-N-acetylmuramic acid kinase [Yoonia sp.]MBE0414587.1 anhydro-N-acetylmuramic acid kinase [Yoonia sp.]